MTYAEFCEKYGGLRHDVFIYALYKIAMKNISEEEFEQIIEETKQEKQEYQDGIDVVNTLMKNQEVVNKQKPTPPPPRIVWR